jgi:hypothetical protein
MLNITTISDTAKQAMCDALVSRGPKKGLLRAKPPRADSLGYAAWQAAQLISNPFKVSMIGQILMSEQQHAVYLELVEVLESLKINNLDRDRNALQSIGVW